MYKGLYDVFKHWYHGGSVWFYSDPHFSDEEMKYLRKNYIGDEEQVKRINSVLGKNDTIVILGDVGNIEWVRKIRGYKVLVMGNHDKGAQNYIKHGGYIRINKDGSKVWDEGSNRLFDEVYEGPVIISDKIILSHEPIDYPYALNIHGHDHSHWDRLDRMHLNMCAEWRDYRPVCLKSIINSGILKNIPNIHRETINKATEKKKERNK